MAGPIKISVLADVEDAIKNVTKFSSHSEEGVQRVVTSMGDPKLTGAWGKWQEGFDVLDTRAMGFRDTVTGVQDSVAGFKAFMGEGEHATASFGDKLLLLGTGVGDLASGMANFLIPMVAIGQSMTALSLASMRAAAATVAHKVAMVAGTVATAAATAAQWALNVALTANPIGLVILAIVALVAAIVIAWRKSDTFRRIVTTAFGAVWGAIKAVWGWIRGNWPMLLAILTGPIGIAVRYIMRHWSTIKRGVAAVWNWIKGRWSALRSILTAPIGAAVRWIIARFRSVVSTVRAMPGRIRAAFGRANSLLIGVGRDIIRGLINGIKNMAGAAANAARNAVGGAISAAKSRLGMRSPSKVFAGIGANIGKGLVVGIDGSAADVGRAMRDLVEAPQARVSSRVTVDGGDGPAWARRQEQLLTALLTALRDGLTISADGTGGSAIESLLEVIADGVTVRGGRGSILGISS